VLSGDETLGDYFIDEIKYRQLASCAVKPGDILVSLVGTIGKVLVLSKNSAPGIINPRLVKLTLHRSIDRHYITIYLRSPVAQSFFSRKSHGGTMDILNLGLLRALPIMLPPINEQAEIARRVDELLARADILQRRYDDTIHRVNKLTPSVLAKAFRGKLVPQDPNDEPAGEMLERVRAERQKTRTLRTSSASQSGTRRKAMA
jgi:type I restriction enzyme S subunit